MDLYQHFTSSSICDFILNHKRSAHLHNLFMDFPQSKVPNGGLHEERYSEKINEIKTSFLQLHVPYTLLGAISILKFVFKQV